MLSGAGHRQVRQMVGCSGATVSYHARKLGLAKAARPSYDWRAVQVMIDQGRSLNSIRAEVGFSKAAQTNAVKRGVIHLPKLPSQMSLDELLTLTSGRRTAPHERKLIRRAMIKDGIANVCSGCGLSTWRGKHLTLEVDHIDGNPRRNEVGNLRLLCPNCHSTTDTWRGRNARKTAAI